jgi:hypothetical protein
MGEDLSRLLVKWEPPSWRQSTAAVVALIAAERSTCGT